MLNWRCREGSNLHRLAYRASARPLRRHQHETMEDRARLELATSRIPTERSANRTLMAQSGAEDRNRTDTFSLTRRAHSHSCSFSMADSTGFEPAIYSVTSCRGRPDSPTSPLNQLTNIHKRLARRKLSPPTFKLNDANAGLICPSASRIADTSCASVTNLCAPLRPRHVGVCE